MSACNDHCNHPLCPIKTRTYFKAIETLDWAKIRKDRKPGTSK